MTTASIPKDASPQIGIKHDSRMMTREALMPNIFGYSELNNSKVLRFGSSTDASTAEDRRYQLSVDSSSRPCIVLTYPPDEVSEGSKQLGFKVAPAHSSEREHANG